jgi:hypothetical protein
MLMTDERATYMFSVSSTLDAASYYWQCSTVAALAVSTTTLLSRSGVLSWQAAGTSCNVATASAYTSQ